MLSMAETAVASTCIPSDSAVKDGSEITNLSPKADDTSDITSSISSRLRRRNRAVVKDISTSATTSASQQTPTQSKEQAKEAKLKEFLEPEDDIFTDSDNPPSDTSAVISTEKKVEEASKAKVKGFACGICGRITSSSQRLKEHLSRHTGEKHLQCEICGKKFAWRYSFRSHMASHSNDNPNECTICGKKYCNKSAVKNHMLRIHGNPSKDFKCEVCGKGFMTKAELERHSFNHSKEKPFVCEFCGNSYRFKGALAVHYRVHSGEKPYKCEYCDMAFIHMSSVIGHRRRHTGEMPFQCNVCGKLFRVKRAMTAHMSVHSEDRPFKCEQCGKTFRSRSGYRVHLDYHLGVKRHTCKHCGRAFRAWCNMHKHMRRHAGERPHVCETCGKAFIEKQELKNHMKCHDESNQKPRKKKEMLSLSTVAMTESMINPTIIAHPPPPPNMCSAASFDDPDEPGDDPLLPTHIELQENGNHTMYDPLVALDKNRTDKCQLLPDAYIPQFFPPQPSAPQYIPQPAPMQSLYGGNSTNHLLSNRTTCVASVNPADFPCSSLNHQNYSGFAFNVPHMAEPLSKCKLCRNLFQSMLGLKRHLLEYHRIEEENIGELLT